MGKAFKDGGDNISSTLLSFVLDFVTKIQNQFPVLSGKILVCGFVCTGGYIMS
jgi:hypothetical protein